MAAGTNCKDKKLDWQRRLIVRSNMAKRGKRRAKAPPSKNVDKRLNPYHAQAVTVIARNRILAGENTNDKTDVWTVPTSKPKSQ